MGRWPYSDRLTVKEAKSITIKYLKTHQYLNPNSVQGGNVDWYVNGQKTSSILIWVSTVQHDGYIRFIYTIPNPQTDEKTHFDYKAKLVWTRCYFGGRRWWFICPWFKCFRKVSALYLGNGKHFGCRHCYNLTYESCQESHKYDTMFKKMGMNPKEGELFFKEQWGLDKLK